MTSGTSHQAADEPLEDDAVAAGPVDTSAAGSVLVTAAASLVAFAPLERLTAGAGDFGRVGAAEGWP